MKLTEELAKWAVEASFNDFPLETIECTKAHPEGSYRDGRFQRA